MKEYEPLFLRQVVPTVLAPFPLGLPEGEQGPISPGTVEAFLHR